MNTRAATSAGTHRGPVVQFLGSLFFTVFLFVWTFLYAIPFVIACAFLPFPRRYALVRLYGHSVLWVLKCSCGLTYTIEGESLPEGAHVALWKHSSTWETMAMMVVFPRQVWVVKHELMWIPVVGLGLRQMHAIAINRRAGHTAVSQVVAQGKDRLAEGDWVMIFPEGTRMAAGETRRYGVSGALLAQQTGACVVPVAHDAGFYWPRRGLLKKPGCIRVVIGPPIAVGGRDVRVVNEEAQAWIEAAIRRLQPGQGA